MPEIAQKNSVLQNNIALANIFHHMSDCYRYLGNEERFRAIAYENVAKILQNMREDIASYATGIKTLDEIGGIGESIAEKIMEYLHTGKIETFEKLKKQVPYDLLQMMDVTGIGPATVKMLYEQLHIRDREDLIHALEVEQLKPIKGFGEKKIASLKRALKLSKTPDRMLLKDAEKIGNDMLSQLIKLPGVEKAALAGSLRRKKETIGDIDIIIQAAAANRKKIVSKFITLPQVDKVLAKGNTKATVLLKKGNVQVDIRLVHADEYGAALLYFTGSKEHNIKLRTLARNSGYKINEYGIFDNASGKRIAGETEAEIYQLLNLEFIPPEQRVDKGEIEKAVKKTNKMNHV